MSAAQKFYYESFVVISNLVPRVILKILPSSQSEKMRRGRDCVISSIPEESVRYREVSAIRRFHCILKCNLFRINWGRSVAFIYCYSSPIHPRFTHKIFPRKTFWNHKIPTRKDIGPTEYHREEILDPQKYPPEKISDPRNTHKEKFKKILDPRNTHEKKFDTIDYMEYTLPRT